MTILKGDVKLVKSESMDDVAEGGGGPTANPVTDGVSNDIFPDISEADRAAGRVSVRKVHAWVQSHDNDTYLGPNVIVAEPPNDPNVSITLFSTNEVFDKRTAAISRIEAYLSVGQNYAGYLFGNHISGQAVLTLFQRTAELPAIGSSLAMTKYEGASNQNVQYVRITEAAAVLQTFTDLAGDYQRYVLTLKISDPLRDDYPGHDIARIDPTKAQLAALTKVSQVIVADASKYYGVVPLQTAATIGDFTLKATGIYTQLVPSAQIETPVSDARTNQISTALVPSGSAVTQSVTATLTTTQNLFVGGAIQPGTFSITNGSATVTDSAGVLIMGGAQVGLIDYENGILSLSTNVFTTGAQNFTINYTPAAVPETINQTKGFKVKIENRSLSYVRTIEPAPTRGSLSVSYLVAGKWYVLRDSGDGALRGQDSSYGAGSVNFSTGTVSVTLGALPDVGSSIIYQWVQPAQAVSSAPVLLQNSGKFYWEFSVSTTNSSGATAPKTIARGAVNVTWTETGYGVHTVIDDSAGNLTEDGVLCGSVDYSGGILRLSPLRTPAKGTLISVSTQERVVQTSTPAIAGSGTSKSGNLGATNITPGSVSFALNAQLRGSYNGLTVAWGNPNSWRIYDDGTGGLKLEIGIGAAAINCGTINYSTGDFSILKNIIIPSGQAVQVTQFDNIYVMEHRTVFIANSSS